MGKKDKEHFDDRVVVQVTTTQAGASDVLHAIEFEAHSMADKDKTWVTVAPVELPDSMQSQKSSDSDHSNEDSWS